MFCNIQALLFLDCDSEPAAAGTRQIREERSKPVNVPRFWRSVTFSLLGSSTILMPNTSMRCVFAAAKTSLNARECDPSTFCAMSCRLMGVRENSQESAYRTRFLDS